MSSVHSRNTRSHQFYLQMPNMPNNKVDSFVTIGTRLWNKFPKELCCKPTYQGFKTTMLKSMIYNYKQKLK
jgi:hypothetical protein